MSWLARPPTPGGVSYLLMIAGVVFGFVVVLIGPWRGGVTVMGLSFAFGVVMRLVLPNRLAGMLCIRGRVIDLIMFGACAAALLILASIVPHGSQ